jgi:lipoprotein-anchoring transpeptidase ErfK/SrfK
VDVRVQISAVVFAAAAVGVGCAGAARAPAAPTAAAPATGASTTGAAVTRTCVPGSKVALGNARRAYAAVVKGRLRAYRQPGRRPFATFGHLNANGVPTVLGILGERVDARCRPVWFHVELPVRPNGATGWVPAGAVAVGSVRTRILVDVSQRRVTLFRDGKPVLTTRAAVGASATPTPLGRYYVNQRLVPRDPNGPYGPGAIGISAYSNVLTGWTQGGPIAIHGTDAPSSIGHAVSNGCIRLHNPVLVRIFRSTLAGTPVIISQ